MEYSDFFGFVFLVFLIFGAESWTGMSTSCAELVILSVVVLNIEIELAKVVLFII